jgi:hypothetical protein
VIVVVVVVVDVVVDVDALPAALARFQDKGNSRAEPQRRRESPQELSLPFE